MLLKDRPGSVRFGNIIIKTSFAFFICVRIWCKWIKAQAGEQKQVSRVVDSMPESSFNEIVVDDLQGRIICVNDQRIRITQPYLNHHFSSYCCSSQIHTKLANDVRTFYFGENGTVGKDSLVEYNDMLSDMWMVVDIDRSAKLHAAKSHGKTFYYRFVLNIYMSLSHNHPIPPLPQSPPRTTIIPLHKHHHPHVQPLVFCRFMLVIV